jgi:hypothetical protein
VVRLDGDRTERRSPVRKRLMLTSIAVFTALGVSAGIALAVSAGPGIRAQGTEAFEANALIQSTFRWSPELVQVQSGTKLSVSSITTGEDPTRSRS